MPVGVLCASLMAVAYVQKPKEAPPDWNATSDNGKPIVSPLMGQYCCPIQIHCLCDPGVIKKKRDTRMGVLLAADVGMRHCCQPSSFGIHTNYALHLPV